ncbi:hypothetical protein D3C72_2549610 [compost metagenome]
MIGKAPAAGGIVERETEIVVDLAGLVPLGGNFPDFLDTEAELLRAGMLVQRKIPDDLLGQ